MFDDLKERISASISAALSPRNLVLGFLDDKLGIHLDPNAHPADNLADVLNHFGAPRSNVDGAEVDKAMENAKFMLKSLAAIDRGRVVAIVAAAAQTVREVEPDKVRALLREILEKVSNDGGRTHDGEPLSGSGSGGSVGASGGRDGDGSDSAGGSGPH